jgi:arginine/lysine/ornithine decarboxylase
MERLEANLHIVQSTSPSYLLMASLDMARQDLALRGKELIGNAVELASYAREEINKIEGFSCFGKEIIGQSGINDLDVTRLTFSGREIGITGFELKSILFEEFNIDIELSDWFNVLAIVTFANKKEDIDRLLGALKVIAGKYKSERKIVYETRIPGIPPYVLSPREAYFSQRDEIPWKDAKGRIAAETIAPYPPGIPVIYPGELVTEEVWEYIEIFRKEKRHLHGPADSSLEMFKVVK